MDEFEFSDDEYYGEEINVRVYRNRTFKIRVEIIPEAEFHERFRLSRRQFSLLLERLEDQIYTMSAKKVAMTPCDKLLVALNFYGTNSPYFSVGDSRGWTKGAICTAIREVTNAINLNLVPEFVRWPKTNFECREIVRKFCEISIDGKFFKFYTAIKFHKRMS